VRRKQPAALALDDGEYPRAIIIDLNRLVLWMHVLLPLVCFLPALCGITVNRTGKRDVLRFIVLIIASIILTTDSYTLCPISGLRVT